MARDQISDRFDKKQQAGKLDERAKKGRSKDEIEAEEKLIKETEKVKPIIADGEPGRNDPCPCGSGKKYKKCCGAKA